jgi:long-chain acyl-CoA synthetase
MQSDRLDRQTADAHANEPTHDGGPDAATLVALFERAAQAHGARPALGFAGGTLSYAALDDAAHALAAWWQAEGVASGDRIALVLPNRPSFVAAALAAWRLGVIVVPVDPQQAADALQQQLGDAGARAVVLGAAQVPSFEAVQHALPAPQVLIAARGDLAGRWIGPLLTRLERRPAAAEPLRGARRLGAALARGRRLALGSPAVHADDIALLQYTSGTTDHAKSAVLLHRQLAANVEQCAERLAPVLARLPAGEQPQLLCALPLHQIFGFTLGLLLGLRWGCCVWLVDSGAPRDLLLAAARRGMHLLLGTPQVFAGLLERPEIERVDWGALQLALGGGMALPEPLARRWFERTGLAITEGYGLAEASPAVTCDTPPARGEWRPPGQVGAPLPGTELRLLDDAGAPVAPDGSGEVAVRGPQVMAGYWQRPDATARAMTAEGFLRTGDLGVLDTAGRLQLLERKGDVVPIGGLVVAPSDVEAVLARMPGVRECAVVGMPGMAGAPGAGRTTLKAVIVRSDPAGTRPSEADVHVYCETHLAGYMRPDIVEFRTDLPKNAVGAPLRRALRA